MTAEAQDFGLRSGDSLEIIFPVKDLGGDAKSLVGAVVKWQMAGSDGTVVLTKSNAPGDGITIPTPSNGRVHVLLLPEDTQELDGVYRHELEVTDAAGRPWTVAVGEVRIDHDIIE